MTRCSAWGNRNQVNLEINSVHDTEIRWQHLDWQLLANDRSLAHSANQLCTRHRDQMATFGLAITSKQLEIKSPRPPIIFKSKYVQKKKKRKKKKGRKEHTQRHTKTHTVARVRMRARAHTHTHIHAYTYSNKHTHTQIHSHTHTHIHTLVIDSRTAPWRVHTFFHFVSPNQYSKHRCVAPSF